MPDRGTTDPETLLANVMHEKDPPNPAQLPIGAILRLAADGELTDQQQDALRLHLERHPEDASRIEFERGLRAACARSCAPEASAPEGLRARVAALCAERETPAGGHGQDRLAAGLAERASQTRQAGYWAGRVVTRFGALAAAVALVALVSFMVGRSWQSPAPPPADGFQLVGDQIAGFARREHSRCAEGVPQLSGKFTIEDPADLPGAFEALVGRPLDLASILDAGPHGLTFRDAGRCHPPGGPALHVRFDSASGGTASLWIQRDDGSLPLEEGVTYASGEGCDCVRFWIAEGVRYILICSEGVASEAAGKALRCPEKTKRF